MLGFFVSGIDFILNNGIIEDIKQTLNRNSKMTKSILVQGTDFIKFYADPSIWDKSTVHDEFLIEVDGVEYDVAQTNTSDDFIQALDSHQTVCVTYGDIQHSPLSPDEKLEAVSTFNQWVRDNKVAAYVTRNMNGVNLGIKRQRIKTIKSNVESDDPGLKDNSIKLLDSLDKMVINAHCYIEKTSLNAEERDLIEDQIIGKELPRRHKNRFITNYFIMGDHVVVEVIERDNNDDELYEYWPFNRKKLAKGDVGCSVICSSIDEAMLISLCQKYDGDNNASPYIARMIGMFT